ncbi:MAG: hypothetical protein C7B47_17495 [Sulfobacillus thermosulfidooxidans]|uniref:Uncharacterized protein n=1 Tax=Sulfobacillus thermosulfidooxidans TaxID=28034 RepID=A0A2T2WFS8_SULTH|nr:MAG: hypothetical protein C7B47_17495 [Sulfobacillus thermosulfidooxidans]
MSENRDQGVEDDEAAQWACNGPRIVGSRHDRWSSRLTAKSSVAARISGRIMGTARIAMGCMGFSGGEMMG